METTTLNQTPASIDDGGLAFPGTRCEQVGNISDHGFAVEGEDDRPTYGDVQHPGMSLRDYFAAQMIVAMGTWMPVPSTGYPSLTSDATLSARAVVAYAQADALITARKAGV